jgi:hypothetical protein
VFKEKLFLVIFIAVASATLAQKSGPRVGSRIIDDSTKNVYGPQTTLWTTEKNIFFNTPVYYALDTTINNYHRWTHVQQTNNFYQDLGNVGTAMNPIFPKISSIIGATAGFNSFNPYFDSGEVKYFNTKSPYTRMRIIWGGNGRATTKIEFSRNINSRWNVGFNYRPILVEKQIGSKGQGDRQTVDHYYDFNTNYFSKDSSYFALFTFQRNRQKVKENGGVIINSPDPDVIFDPNAKTNLTTAGNEEFRWNMHFFQQYKIAKQLQVYHILDWGSQTNKFNANEGDSATLNRRKVKGEVFDETEFKVFQNEAGIKGDLGFLFYNFYAKNRSYQNHNLRKGDNRLTTGSENFLGARASLKMDSLTRLSGQVENLIGSVNYLLSGSFESPWLDASLKSTLAKPSYLHQSYIGSYDLWNNNFNNVSSTQINGFIKANIGPVTISPGANFYTFNNYIFFRKDSANQGQKIAPFQSSGSQVIFSPEVKMTLRILKKIYFRPQIIYTNVIKNDDSAFQIPQLFINGQLAYEGFWFKNHLQVQFGVDFHWKSDYNAQAYNPSVQSFYVQNTANIPSFLLADVFLNGKIKRGRVFIKYHNLLNAFTPTGYFPTPNYPGRFNVLDFGFELLLFD